MRRDDNIYRETKQKTERGFKMKNAKESKKAKKENRGSKYHNLNSENTFTLEEVKAYFKKLQAFRAMGR